MPSFLVLCLDMYELYDPQQPVILYMLYAWKLQQLILFFSQIPIIEEITHIE